MSIFFNDSKRLFNDLWNEWLDTQLPNIVGDTPLEETDCEDILKCLPPDTRQNLLDMQKRFAEKASIEGILDKAMQTEQPKDDTRRTDRNFLCTGHVSLLERLYMGNLCPIEEAIPHSTEYRALSYKIGEEREYFEGILPPEQKERFEKWNMMIFPLRGFNRVCKFRTGFSIRHNAYV